MSVGTQDRDFERAGPIPLAVFIDRLMGHYDSIGASKGTKDQSRRSFAEFMRRTGARATAHLNDAEDAQPVIANHIPAFRPDEYLRLEGRGDPAFVFGKRVTISPAEFDLLDALLKGGVFGFHGSQIDERCGGGWRKTLRKLRKRVTDFHNIIKPAITPYERYRIELTPEAYERNIAWLSALRRGPHVPHVAP